MTHAIRTLQLPSGHSIPVFGLGVFQSRPGTETYSAVCQALELGYRHIDTAEGYGNEADVGRAITDSGIPRQDVFVTSKYMAQSWSYADTMRAVRASVDKIGGYVDLFLLHAPGSSYGRAEAWRALEDAKEKGLVRDIGVSNFGEKHLQKLAQTWKEKPAVNQVELHPWLCRRDLVKYCSDKGILLEAYSPLARAYKLRDPVVGAIAQSVHATPAQVLVAWSLAKGFIAIPKTVRSERLEENLAATAVTLDAEQIAALDALDRYMVTSWDPVKDHPV